MLAMKTRVTIRMSESELALARAEASKRGVFVNELLMLGLSMLAGAHATRERSVTLEEELRNEPGRG